MTVTETTFDHGYKRHRNGRFFDLKADPNDAKARTVGDLCGPTLRDSIQTKK